MSDPTDVVQYLTVDEVLVLHARLVVRFGGAGGVRDPGLLESALFRPRTGYYADLAEMSAALMESLLMNDCFVDGNKRVAFFATDVFLRVNGWKLAVDDNAAYAFLIEALEKRRATFATLLPWIRTHVIRLR